jgi:hypothetical protein
MRLTIGPCRISYANLFNPRPSATPGAKPKYGVTILIPKSATMTKAKIDAAIAETRKEYLAKNGAAKWVNACQTTLYDGDGTKKSGEDFGPECAGHWVLSTSSIKAPIVVDQNKQPVMVPEFVYSGCYGLCIINFYAYDTSGNKGLACAIDGFMKTADGELLGGHRISDSDWDNVAADDLNIQLEAQLASMM